MHYTKSLQAEPRTERVKKFPLWRKNLPYYLLILALAPDFKGGAGSSARIDQTLEFILFIVATIWVLCKKRSSSAPPLLTKVSIAWWTMILLGGFASIYTVFPPPWASQTALDSFIVAIPGLIVGAILLASQTLNINGQNWFTFRKTILWAGLISATAQGISGLASGSGGEEAQLGVSLSTLFLFSIGFIEVVVPGLAFDYLSVLSLIASLVFLGISVERTYLITAIFVLIVVMLMMFKMKQAVNVRGFYKQLLGRLFLISIFVVLGMSILLAIRPNVFNKWQEKFTKLIKPSENAQYNTPAIRLSQFEYSARLLLDDPLRLATGAGYQRSYPIIGSKNRFMFIKGATYDMFSQADVLWYFPFLTSGLIGGLLFVGVYGTLIVVGVKRFRLLTQMTVAERWQTCVGIILLTTATASSIGINGLYFRTWSLMFGLSAAMLLSPVRSASKKESVPMKPSLLA